MVKKLRIENYGNGLSIGGNKSDNFIIIRKFDFKLNGCIVKWLNCYNKAVNIQSDASD